MLTVLHFISTTFSVLTPEVIPVVEEVVPSSQIITISNPLQPIDLTSLRERQSTTPGGPLNMKLFFLYSIPLKNQVKI